MMPMMRSRKLPVEKGIDLRYRLNLWDLLIKNSQKSGARGLPVRVNCTSEKALGRRSQQILDLTHRPYNHNQDWDSLVCALTLVSGAI